jgi:uncharacterized protein (TIGR03000 family)
MLLAAKTVVLAATMLLSTVEQSQAQVGSRGGNPQGHRAGTKVGMRSHHYNPYYATSDNAYGSSYYRLTFYGPHNSPIYGIYDESFGLPVQRLTFYGAYNSPNYVIYNPPYVAPTYLIAADEPFPPNSVYFYGSTPYYPEIWPSIQPPPFYVSTASTPPAFYPLQTTYVSATMTTPAAIDPLPATLPASAERSASIDIVVPDGAEVWFNGQKTAQTSATRHFETPALPPGKLQTYEVRASWMENGAKVNQTHQVQVHAGKQMVLNLMPAKAPR